MAVAALLGPVAAQEAGKEVPALVTSVVVPCAPHELVTRVLVSVAAVPMEVAVLPSTAVPALLPMVVPALLPMAVPASVAVLLPPH